MKGRLIKKFVPLLNLDAIDQGIVSVVTLKVPPSEVNTLAKKLAGSEEVAGVYVTAGEHRECTRAGTFLVRDSREPRLRSGRERDPFKYRKRRAAGQAQERSHPGVEVRPLQRTD